MKYREAVECAKKINANLAADNDGFSHAVHIMHEEGTVLFYRCAFFERHDEWVFIFTEHHGFHVYNNEDLLRVSEYILYYHD